MKKILTLLCALLVVLTLTGCAKDLPAQEATADDTKDIIIDNVAVAESLEVASEVR